MTAESLTNPIDRLMERASRELFETRYFDAAESCVDALRMARSGDDFARMARICLPLQEARRWIRQTALDTGSVRVVADSAHLPEPLGPGCYLVEPPLVGIDGRRLRQHAWREGVAVAVLCREPMNRQGLWPIVGVGERVVRVRIDPPSNVRRVAEPPRGPTGDRIEGEIDPAWFAEAGEALGDRAIVDAEAAGDEHDPPAWRVDDLLDLLEAAPDHEKLVQSLARACREAVGTTTPTDLRRRRGMDDPNSF
ncbi:MAG: hypothetical protein AAGA55_04290 [Planctomycetota bacterium]